MNSISFALGAFGALVLLSACASHSKPQLTTLADISGGALIGEWNVEQIEGVSLVEQGNAFLGFSGDGRIYGNTSVNKLLGSWSLRSGDLQLSNVGSTRMAGPPELMEQESKLLDALGRVAQAQRRIDGWLVLLSADGDSLITASHRP